MKNKFGKIAFAIILVFASAAMADEEKMSYTVHAGINFSSIGSFFSSIGGAGSRFGFHVGGMADIPLTKINLADDAYMIETHPGAQFIKKGGRVWMYTNYVNWYTYEVLNTEVDVYYLETPILFSIKKNFSDNIAARIDAGPYFAFGLFGTEDVFDELSRFDLGAIYGIAIDFVKRFNLGLYSSTGFSEDNISCFYTTLGYRF